MVEEEHKFRVWVTIPGHMSRHFHFHYQTKRESKWLFAKQGGGRDAYDIISLEKMALYVLDTA